MAYLLGGLILLKLRIIRWHIPMAMLAGLVFTALLTQLFAPMKKP
ncbi:RnfABCDGE type electron transport complex subunit D [Vibrio cholerae]